MPQGTVVKIVRSRYFTRLNNTDQIVSAILPGKHKRELKSTHSLVNVGDHIHIELSGADWIISKIDPPRNKISRISPQNRNDERILVTNIDQMLIVSSAQDPKINPRLIDRYLVIANRFDIPAHILVSKMDLIDEKDSFIDNMVERYTNCDVDLSFISIKEDTHRPGLSDKIANKVNAVVGSSGVGKSSIIAYMDDCYEDIRIGDISQHTSKGTHTTTTVEMYYLKKYHAYIVDTPGIREFGIYGINKDVLWHYFTDLEKIGYGCKFKNCQHMSEPGCEVHKALKNGSMNKDRYQSYCNIYASIGKTFK